MNSPVLLYALTFAGALILSLIFTPAARTAAVVLDVWDRPLSAVKTHKEPTPYLGGVAIFAAFALSLLWIRVLTSFPTGTLRALRGILIGGGIIFVVGLIDDAKYDGLHYRTKFIMQIAASLLLMLFGIRVRFIQPAWLAYAVTLIWIVGVTNAFNLIDIMDGLASGVSVVTSLAFLFISLPTEEIYVNFAAAALAGATLGFFPFNLSKKWKIFMGDSGSLVLGFMASALSLGTSYSGKTELGVLAPIIILALPIFDTLLVFYLRLRRGASPFLGSKDHFALRLEALGWTRGWIVAFSIGFTTVLGLAAFFATQADLLTSIWIYAGLVVLLSGFTFYVMRARVVH